MHLERRAAWTGVTRHRKIHFGMSAAKIAIVSRKIAHEVLAEFLGRPFADMIKFVVDLERRRIALGGELQADAEEVLIEGGSSQSSLWGGNYFPGRGAEGCLHFTSLINIRPSQGNPTMVVADEAIRGRIRELVFELVGRGEALP